MATARNNSASLPARGRYDAKHTSGFVDILLLLYAKPLEPIASDRVQPFGLQHVNPFAAAALDIDKARLQEHPQMPARSWPAAGKARSDIACRDAPTPRIQHNENVPA